MVALPLDSNNQVVPPWDSYLTFSNDVAAALEVYCDGGDDTMLQNWLLLGGVFIQPR